MSLPVSVITPSFNQGAFIERTIQSVLAQNIAGLEYVVLDGGSTDETLSILQHHDSSVRWISEHDRGQTHAVNKGLAATSGDVIGWLNSDDVYYPNAVQTVVSLFEAHPEIDVVYGNAFHIDENDAVIEPYYTEPWDAERLKEICFLCQPAAFFRRSVIERFGPLDESLNFCMDYEYWLRLAVGGARFAYVQQTLAGSRLYASNKTLGSRVKVHAEIASMLKGKFGSVPAQWLINYAWARATENPSVKPEGILFALRVSTFALSATLRWNRGISMAIGKQVARWLAGSVWVTLRGRKTSQVLDANKR